MEPINHFGFSFNNIHQKLPIRQFSQAARVEEQHQLLAEESWELLQHFDDQVYPSGMATSVDSMEEYQFVDSFFNIDHIHHGELPSSPEENHLDQLFDSFLHDVDLNSFLMPNDPMLIQEEYDLIDMSSSCEDTAFVSSLSSSSLSDISIQPIYDNSTTTFITSTIEDQDQDRLRVNGVDDGLQLVHLLLACAEAVGCRDTQLADSILSKIWYSANPLGDSLQRVSYFFAMGLKSRLSLLQTNVNANGTISISNGWGRATLPTDIQREEKIEAFHLLHQTTPYIKFGFIAANEAIFQAAKGKDCLHIIDLGMEHTLQWPSLIRTLGSTTDGGVSPKLIRITGILGDRGEMMELESSMKETIVAEANSLGIEVEFRLISGPATPAMLTKENLRLKEGEPLFVNSILHLHTYVKESRGSLKTILQAVKKLGPTLLTVVEQDANHNGPFFLGRFLESLHYYSAIFDSLEASMGRNSIERLKIERNHFAEEIRNIVAYEGTERVERHERADQWRRQLGRAGFQVVAGVKERQATAMKSVSGCDGYTVGNDQKGHVLLELA
ncbi:Transcription factor GRAS [Cynara cardunculus var. scolymus]|uniref:Transcription factor GRAS n=1 Tax=Cynara cardunculus var. scolymus TaxID=59895 RepID=A0A118K676_CYNCS|nr:Transcription factor GRAS [Cynara cardunculus var. scolymus]